MAVDGFSQELALQVFRYDTDEERQFSELRTIEEDGKIFFCATDVAKMLGYSNPNDAIIKHCKPGGIAIREVGVQTGVKQDGTPSMQFINLKFITEGNVYRLISRSNLPSAEKFESWLFDEVVPSIRQKGYYGKIDRREVPNFYKRYQLNWQKISHGYFSVINELVVVLGSELEKYGYIIPDKAIDGRGMYPDISVGKTFSQYLQKIKHPNADNFEHYDHEFSDGRQPCKARMYSLDLLPAFRRFVIEEWIPKYGENYFKARDPKALDYLPKLLPVIKPTAKFIENLAITLKEPPK
jgi:prophage antirepressor-like protein